MLKCDSSTSGADLAGAAADRLRQGRRREGSYTHTSSFRRLGSSCISAYSNSSFIAVAVPLEYLATHVHLALDPCSQDSSCFF